MRSVPEWIPNNDDAKIPPRVMLRIFFKHGGRCACCGRRIAPGETWDADHIIALANGGQHREMNLQPLLRDHHKAKTARDVAEKSATARQVKKHIGIRKPSRMPGSRNSRFKKKLNGEVVAR